MRRGLKIGGSKKNRKEVHFAAKILLHPSPVLPSYATRHGAGPFVYRLGRQVFNLERGVRFPYGLPKSIEINGLQCQQAICRLYKFQWVSALSANNPSTKRAPPLLPFPVRLSRVSSTLRIVEMRGLVPNAPKTASPFRT